MFVIKLWRIDKKLLRWSLRFFVFFGENIKLKTHNNRSHQHIGQAYLSSKFTIFQFF